MKRVLAMVLTVLLLVGLFPVSLIAQANTVTKEPFYFLNFDRSFDAKEYSYTYWQPYTWINKEKFNAESESINIGLYFNGFSTSDVEDAAAELYDEFKNRPAGTRYISFNAMKTVFEKCVKDAVDMEDGVRLVKEWLGRFLDAYKALGGELDGLNIDLEYNDAYNFYIESVHYNNSNESLRNRNIYNDIVANKVYQTRIRPKLVEYEKLGLWQFYVNPDPAKYPYRSEIWTMYRHDKDGGNATCRSTWNRVIQELMVEYINEATYEPLIARYPNAILSDYGTADSYAWNKTMSTSGSSTGNSVKAGNASDESYYNSAFSPYYFASSSTSKTRKIYDKPAGSNDAVFNPETPYTRALYDINTQKRILASTQEMTPDNKNDDHVNVHVGFFNYGARTGYANTPYFTEMIYHMGMTNPEPFFGYILPRDVEKAGEDYSDPDIGDYYVSLQIADELMIELTRVAGASDRQAILTPIAWNDDYILSGMYAGGRNIWRITPNTAEVSKEAFKIKDRAPTFQVNGLTITFPQGRIIEDGKVSKIGSCGYWVETPANVMPVVVSNINRYAEDPSFEDNFSGYKTGAFTGSATSQTGLLSSAHADTYWTATGTAEIVDKSGNKAISLIGTTSLDNTLVPAKITAGDYYAKQQAWEVTVTLPASSAYTSVNVLDFDDSDTDTKDVISGFQVSGGQIKYVDGTATKTMKVNVSAGGTYTFKRVLDFSKDQVYTGSFYVYDSAGNLMDSAENVSIVAASVVTLPVNKITISTTGATAAVAVDNYKLYPRSLAYDIEIYDANSGRKIADANAVRTERTAFRMSWMNATTQYKVARIYDVKSGLILKKVDMAPGMDGIVTGIVEVADGKSIQIAVDVQDATAPTQPNYDGGDFSWTAVSESVGLATGPKPAVENGNGGNTGAGNTGTGNTDSGNTGTGNAGTGSTGNGNTGNGNTGNTGTVTPENPGVGEEGGNIYDDGIVEGTPEYPSDENPAGDGGNGTGNAGGNDTTTGRPNTGNSTGDKNNSNTSEDKDEQKDETQNDTKKGNGKKEGNGRIILLIVALCVLVLAGAAVAILLFVVKPRQAAKAAEDLPVEEINEDAEAFPEE